jgi:hypothetical protein
MEALFYEIYYFANLMTLLHQPSAPLRFVDKKSAH